MKILQINAVSGIRSTGRTCTEMADYLNRNGHEAYIAYSFGMPYEKGYKIGNYLEIKIHSQLSKVFGLQGYFSQHGTKKLIQYMDELKPDIVHLRNLHSSYINLRLLLTYLAENDIPTVLTLHDCWFFTGGCCYYSERECFRWQIDCRGCPGSGETGSGFFPWTAKKMYRDKKQLLGEVPRLAVVGVSDWITGEAKKSFLSSAKILRRIYNWIDMDVFKPVDAFSLRKKFGLEDKFIILGVASIWDNRKGLDIFIELSGRVPEEIAVMLVGNIDVRVKLPKNILNIKETHDAGELAGYYSMADALFNPSMEETFGKTTAEALACGTPVIVMNSTASPELVGDGTGYVLERAEPESVLSAVTEIRTNGKERYSGECVAFARKNFNMKDRIDDYLRVYGELIEVGMA